MTLLVGMVADDLTGALDATAPFAERGLRTVVVVSPDGAIGAGELADAEVICVNTASREIDAAEAERRVREATKGLLGLAPQVLFKKIDSRLKGHLAVEIAAMVAASGRSLPVVAPAIPDLGRRVVDGRLVGAGVPEPLVIAERLRPLVADVPETPDQAALEAVAEWIVADGAVCIAVGARGLSQAIANLLPSRAVRRRDGGLPYPCVLAIGSRDPVTRAQIERLAGDARHVRAPNGALSGLDFSPGITLVTAEEGAGVEDGKVVAARFAEGLSRAIAASPPASLLISGGETAYAVLTRLGVSAITVEGEALPGVPFATTLIGGRQVVILTKSGGFGAPDTISLLVRQPVELN